MGALRQTDSRGRVRRAGRRLRSARPRSTAVALVSAAALVAGGIGWAQDGGSGTSAPETTAKAPAGEVAPAARTEPAPTARPDFKAPFQCGEKEWTYFSEHDYPGAIDINWRSGQADMGKPVLASADGTVNLGEGGGAGKYVELDHGAGWQTRYLHLKSQGVKDGQKVKQGDVIGELGDTDAEGSPHLHFDQRLNGEGVEVHLEGKNLAPYPDQSNRKPLTSTNCPGGGGGDNPPPPPPPPAKQATKLEYTGPGSVANGSPAEVSARLTADGGKPVADRKVRLTLGGGDTAQSCEGTTGAEGGATCRIDTAKQPLNGEGTLPVRAEFAGDGQFEPSKADARVKLAHVTGRATGLTVKSPLPGLEAVGPAPDTGDVRSADTGRQAPPCAAEVRAVLLTAGTLCAEVNTRPGPLSSTATASVERVKLGLPALPAIEVSGVSSRSTSTCERQTGSVDLDLTVGGRKIDTGGVADQKVDLGLGGAQLVVNEQVKGPDGALTVNAVHLKAPGGVDVTLASSTSAARNCT
ncbi:M23 family metallopeptidase [Streptomyces sp. HNM0574]|uniref:M23 family metallopeptidase n=1 Tax=Streptomyces sp. HNM0574 TaxID=2714954 RepID=UPI00146C78E9|nr:M23 family metallopeptidase [Streptomyces sp. HNM0574]NLU68823.1 M23 family metallopeptidase [Streptomyces sp. HNM0574]